MLRRYGIQGRRRAASRVSCIYRLWSCVWLGFFCLAGIGWASSPVLAAADGRIQGSVQKQGQGIAQHRIMLIRFGPNRDVQRTPGQTDTEGRFVFDGLETGEAFEYVVGIRYAGRLYQSEPVRLRSGQQRTDIVVRVTPPAPKPDTTSRPLLHIANQLEVVVYRDDHLEVREIVRLLNPERNGPSDSPATSETAALTFRLPLPQGYTRLIDLRGLDRNRVRLLDSGLYYSGPLAPGEHRIVYTYSLPFRDPMTTILVERTLPTAMLDVLIDDTRLIATSDLEFRGRVSLEPHTFFHFRGTDLEAESRSWFQLTRRSAVTPLFRGLTYAVMLGIVLLGIGLPLYGGWRRHMRQKGSGEVKPEPLQEPNVTRLHLLRAIARLDDQHQEGELADDVYQQQRQMYKAQLVEIVEQLRDAQQDKDGAPDGA